jgi:hypothetical protein
VGGYAPARTETMTAPISFGNIAPPRELTPG